MRPQDLPFNVTVMDNSKAKFSNLPEITSLDIFDGMSREFHHQGLFSVPVFGRVGEERRLDSFAHINLRTEVIHPFLYKKLVGLKGLYGEIAMGKAYAIWDDKLKDFVRSTELEGTTGYSFLFKHVKDIKFKRTNSFKRGQVIELLEKYKDRMFCRYLLVGPAGLRDIEIKDGRTSEDEINDFYRAAIRGATAVVGNEESLNDRINDLARAGIQNAFNNIFETVFKIIEGKKGFFLSKWKSRRVFYGTANVISSKEISSKSLRYGDVYDPRVSYVGIYQALAGNRSRVLHPLLTGFVRNIFDSTCRLVDKNHNVVLVPMNEKISNDWVTSEGLDAKISLMKNEKIRHNPARVNEHYLCNIYDDGKNVKLFTSMDDIVDFFPEEINVEDHEKYFKSLIENKVIRHATLTEFFYIITADIFSELYATITRYPIATFGSIYVSMVKVKTTTTGETRIIHDAEGLRPPMTVHQFPKTLARMGFLNTLQVDVTRISSNGGLGADFDGDRCTCIFIFTEEAIAEAREGLTNIKRLISPVSGKLEITCNTETIERAMINMSMGMR